MTAHKRLKLKLNLYLEPGKTGGTKRKQVKLQDNSFSDRIYRGANRGLSGKAAVVFEELERRLMYGVYKFGMIIPSSEITKEFGISRAPLYAALNQLQFEGYIETTPQVGSRVITPTDQQVNDYFVMFGLV